MPFFNAFNGKKVLVTGHSGFKGSWLCKWLLDLGAQVTGYSLHPEELSLYRQLGLSGVVTDIFNDIRDLNAVRHAVGDLKPDFIFHLAAQPLVRLSYDQPIETYAINVMGTAHILEAARLSNHACSVVIVTTDKCYENQEWIHSYREIDPMGGHDPYSSSKGAAELLTSTYRRSYFSNQKSKIKLASARAGNVIGGGDWATDRILPDCIRALSKNENIVVRNKISRRPWQHVLEPLSGYLQLAAMLHLSTASKNYESAFNFGPSLASNRTVAEVVDEVLLHWPGSWLDQSDPTAVHEAVLLNLATDKAHHLLGWQPVWSFKETVTETVNWYLHQHEDPESANFLTTSQIAAYQKRAAELSLSWAK